MFFHLFNSFLVCTANINPHLGGFILSVKSVKCPLCKYFNLIYYLIMNLKQAVIIYIKSLSDQERQSLINMVKNGIKCCVGYAETKGINPDLFNSELKAILLEE